MLFKYSQENRIKKYEFIFIFLLSLSFEVIILLREL
jgi:hypothetical protein